MDDRELQRRAIEVLDRVLDLGPDECDAVLDAECAGHPELRALVHSLLSADRADQALLDADAGSVVDPLDPRPDHPRRVGPYRVLAEVGRGGMATVYLAERDAGEARQRVALKVLRRGIDTDEVLRRFAQEARVLASLEHPGIARFYDARASEEGTPYLAMEFIHGRPLTEHCDAERLEIRDRLALFGAVCQAVEFAHQRLVVHRDLKPSNILVTQSGEVKLLDFGIAKLISDEPDAHSPRTRTGMLVLTPEYAAPEQTEGGPITTATDVYALGVILHVLLVGTRPGREGATSSRTAGSGSSASEIRGLGASIRHATREGTAQSVADARSTTPGRLHRLLQGDLETIVMKALAADPAHRYRSAKELADDLERYLEGRPIEARPATLGYRLGKFVRRHRAGVVAGVTAAVLLLGFSAVYTVGVARQRDLAEAEADKARITTEFLQRLLGEAYPSTALGDAFSMSELLSRAVARVDSIDAQPEIQAELLRTIGDVYREQARFDEALPLLERAVRLHRERAWIVSRSGGEALEALGYLHYQVGDYDAALALHREALEVFRTVYEADDYRVLYALSNIAADAAAVEDFDEALRLHRLVLARSEPLFPDTSELMHVTYNNLGNLYQRMGEHELAEQALSTAVELRRRALRADHPSLALSLNNLGVSLRQLGRLDEAERVHRESLEVFQRVFEPDHPRIGLAAFNLAQVQRSAGRYAQAEENFRLTLAIDRKTYGERHMEVGVDLRTLGFLLEEGGDCAGAAEALGEADAIFEANELPVTNRRRLSARARLGACLVRLGRPDEAEEVLRSGLLAVRADPEGVDDDAVEETIEHLDALYRAQGRTATADSVRLLVASPSG